MGSPVTFPVTLDRQDGSTVLEGELTATSGLPAAALTQVFLYNPTGFNAQVPFAYSDTTYVGQVVTALPVTVGVGAVVVAGAFAVGSSSCGLGVTGVPDPAPGSADCSLGIQVTDALGANTLSATGGGSIVAGDNRFDLHGVSPSIAGTDLSVDAGTGNIVSAAGGTYYVLVYGSVGNS